MPLSERVDPFNAPAVSLLLIAVLTGCPAPVAPAVDAGVTEDAGTDAGGETSPDAGLPLVPGWNPTTQVGPTRDGFSTEIRNVDVDLGSSGTEALVVWEEAGDARGSVWARRFAKGAWLPEERLSGDDVHASIPRVAFNDAGQGAAVYNVLERDAAGEALGRTVWFRRLEGTRWSTPERLSPEPAAASQSLFEASDPRVGMDGAGRITVVWSQYAFNDPDRSGLYTRRHDEVSWGEPLRLDDGSLPASDPQLAVGAGGRAVAVWIQDTNPYDPGKPGGGPRVPNVWARTFDGSAWSLPARIGPELTDFEGTERPVVAIDAEGRAFALWEEHRSEQARIGAVRFDPALDAWGEPATIASSVAPTDHLSFLSVATDRHGNAFATWTASLPDSDDASGMASRFDAAGSAWSAPSAFTTRWSLDPTRAAMGTTGQGWALYTQPNEAGTSELTARELGADGSWGPAQIIGHGLIADAEANGEGVVLVGARLSWYCSSQPLMREAPAATFYLPR
jgi:hypothetical protein